MRQAIYLDAIAQASPNTVVTEGQYRVNQVTCRRCGSRIPRPEEKKTDVNIALGILEAAITGACEKIVIVSGDTDLVPAITAVRRLTPSVKVVVAFPPKRNRSKELKREAGACSLGPAALASG